MGLLASEGRGSAHSSGALAFTWPEDATPSSVPFSCPTSVPEAAFSSSRKVEGKREGGMLTSVTVTVTAAAALVRPARSATVTPSVYT